MTVIHPQYIKDGDGNVTFVVLKVDEFDKIIEVIEDWDDVQVYDSAKENDPGERIPIAEAFNLVEAKKLI